jgi:hypothetical protein
VPVLECCEALRIDVGTETLEHGFADDLAALVDGNFDDFVAGRGGELPREDNRIGGRDGKRGADLIAVELAASERSIGKTRLRAVAESGERLGFRPVLLFSASYGRLRSLQFRELRRSLPSQLLCKALVLVPFGGEIGRAVTAVVGIFAGPEQASDGRAILTESNGHWSQQPRRGSVKKPGKNYRVEADRGRKKSTLTPYSRRIRWFEHEDFPNGLALLLVRRMLAGFVKVICEVRNRACSASGLVRIREG